MKSSSDHSEAVTKRFVNEEVTPSLNDTTVVVDQLLAKYPKGTIVQLTFHGDQAQLPIVSEMLKKYPLDLNIIEGGIHQTQEGAIGSLYLQLTGDQEQIKGALAYLQTMRVETEVLNRE